MKHPHHEVIVAWAEGKPIQRFNALLNQWSDWPHVFPPGFSPEEQYRITPRTAFQVYSEAAYPNYKGPWSCDAQSPMEVGLTAVVNAVKSGELK